MFIKLISVWITIFLIIFEQLDDLFVCGPRLRKLESELKQKL